MQNGSQAETRRRILDTAKVLLRRYGPDKMTVMDIARELKMSHANVYRFFRTKSEILDALIDEWLSQIEAFVETVAARATPASDRLEAVVLELHRKRRQKLLDDAEFYETYKRVIELRPDFAEKRREKIFNVFRRLIEEGIEAGEFKAVDSNEAANVLKDASAIFLHPLMIPTVLKEDTETRARNVVRYVIEGFSARAAKVQTKGILRRGALRK
jgi:AcrR family transcriptional regulator